MILYSIGPRGGLKKVKKIPFAENGVYLIDDYKIIYLWHGSKVTKARRQVSEKKAKGLNKKKDNPARLIRQDQDQEYGSFLVIKDLLGRGIARADVSDRRVELEMEYEDTMELVELGLDPDFEGEITIAAHDLLEEDKSYEDLCLELAKIQLFLIKGKATCTKKELKDKTEEILKSTSTYDELCWLIAELTKIKEK